MTELKLINEPITIGPRTLKGRVFLPPHQPGLARGGNVTDAYVAYHRARARAGVAMQSTGANPVAPSAEWADTCLWNIDESIVPGYQRVADAVHEEGGTMLVQLAHPGPTEYEGVEVLGPSWDFSEVSRQIVTPATASQIERVISEYVAAADRVRRGGMDGVELSMAHGLLLAAFLSPLTNHRDDQFGGDPERRLEFPRRLLTAVREVIGPDLILGVRLGVDDLVEGGLTPETAADVAAGLEPYCDYLSVMVGNNNRLEARVKHWPPTPAPQGLFRSVGRVIKQKVKKPVAIVGRIKSLELAEDILANGDADMVGIVRAHIADPELIPKTKSGHVEDVRPCVGVNVCTNGLLAKKPLACMVNPDVGDTRLQLIDPQSLRGHRSVVVGAGPAGLEAARRLALAGSAVTVFEAEDVVGGQVALWSLAPSRSEVHDYIDWQLRQLGKLGVDLRTGIRAGAAEIAALEPHDTLVATGAAPAHRAVPSDDGSVRVFNARDAFTLPPSGRIVVFDEIGELDGSLLSEFLQARGNHVTLVTSRIHVGEGEGVNTLFPMLRTLAERGIDVIERYRPLSVDQQQIVLEGVFGGPNRTLAADALVSWNGGVPVNDLSADAEGLGTLTVIGDALRPRRVKDATADAKAAVEAVSKRHTSANSPV